MVGHYSKHIMDKMCSSQSDHHLQTSSVVLPNKTLLFLHHDENQDVVFCNIILC